MSNVKGKKLQNVLELLHVLNSIYDTRSEKYLGSFKESLNEWFERSWIYEIGLFL